MKRDRGIHGARLVTIPAGLGTFVGQRSETGNHGGLDFRILGMCPTPALGAADITSLYTARYGAPPVGTKVYVRVNQLVNGWESLGRSFWGIVPASA